MRRVKLQSPVAKNSTFDRRTGIQKLYFCTHIIRIFTGCPSWHHTESSVRRGRLVAVMSPVPELKKSLVDETTAKDVENGEKPDNSAHEEVFLYRLPFSSQFYYMMRPVENVHIYVWIIKDLSWSQDWYYPTLIFGALALLWCGMLLQEAVRTRSLYEVYMISGTTLWLAANYTWMAGEVINTDDAKVVPPSAIMMETAIAWFLLYFLVLKPLKLLTIDDEYTERLRAIGLYSRFSYFENWREYEHAHTLLWLCKDLCWNQDEPIAWIIFIIPTMLVGFDFVYTTWRTKRMFIDCSHYAAQFLWVAGNALWAMGEVFNFKGSDDDAPPHPLFQPTAEASHKMRWWSSVCLFCSIIPLVCLYLVWYPLTCLELVKAADIEENKHVKDVLCGGKDTDDTVDVVGEDVKPPLANVHSVSANVL